MVWVKKSLLVTEELLPPTHNCLHFTIKTTSMYGFLNLECAVQNKFIMNEKLITVLFDKRRNTISWCQWVGGGNHSCTSSDHWHMMSLLFVLCHELTSLTLQKSELYKY